MSNLAETIDSVVVTLDAVASELQGNTNDFSVAPYKDWCEYWGKVLDKRSMLGDIKADIIQRDFAFDLLKQFKNCPIRCTSRDPVDFNVSFCSSSIDASLARHFLMVSYLASTWSVYDAIYDLTTRLLGARSVFQNPKPSDNRKIAELFSKPAAVYGGMDGLFIRYSGIYKVSYVLRNAFMHEGGRINGKKILEGNLTDEYFRISKATIEYLSGNDVAGNVLPSSLLSGSSLVVGNHFAIVGHTVSGPTVSAYKAPWFDEDIRVILYHYNAKLDDLMAHMLVYAANSLKAHINQCFSVPMSISDARIIK